MTVEEDDRRRALLTPGEKRDLQRRHLDDLAAIGSGLERALRLIDLVIDDDVIDNHDFHLACDVETYLKEAAETVDEFTKYRNLSLIHI